MGMEMSAVHAGDVRYPEKDYPRALAYSSLIILATLILSSLAITVVVPLNQLNLVSGLIDAFKVFLDAYHLSYLVPALAILIVLGSLSGAAAWIIGPARGLFIANQDAALPLFFRKLNSKNVPVGILLTQGLIVSLLCLVFFIMPTVKSSYWLLSNLTAQLALLFYILLFSAAIRLRYKCSQTKRAFKIPGGTLGIYLVSGVGIFTCFIAIILGFLPPTQIEVGKVLNYEILLVAGIVLFCLPPFIFTVFSKR
jgi:amino acid transporter